MLCNVGVNAWQIKSSNIAAFNVDKPLILYLLSWLSFLFKLQDQKGVKCCQIFSLLCLLALLCEWPSNSIYFCNSWALSDLGFGVCSKIPALSSMWWRCFSVYELKGHHLLNCFFFPFSTTLELSEVYCLREWKTLSHLSSNDKVKISVQRRTISQGLTWGCLQSVHQWNLGQRRSTEQPLLLLLKGLWYDVLI